MSMILHMLAQCINSAEPADVITVPTRTITTTFVSGGSGNAGVEFHPDGDIVAPSGTPSSALGDWIDPKSSAPGDYEIRATLISGTVTSGTIGTWQALTSSRTWSITNGISRTTQIFFEIRDGEGTVQDDGTITLILDKII